MWGLEDRVSFILSVDLKFTLGILVYEKLFIFILPQLETSSLSLGKKKKEDFLKN